MSYINILENISLITGLIYVVLATKEKYFAWIFGVISSLVVLYIYLLQDVYLQALLNFYYVVIGIYGYFTWKKRDSDQSYFVKITEYKIKTHALMVLLFVTTGLILFYIMNYYFKSNFAFLDSMIFTSSIIATFMQTKKILSNWLYWIIINGLSIILTINLELYYLSLLMAIFLVVAIFGYISWRKEYLGYKKNNV